MEWKIFGMVWKISGMKDFAYCRRFAFHSIVCPAACARMTRKIVKRSAF